MCKGSKLNLQTEDQLTLDSHEETYFLYQDCGSVAEGRQRISHLYTDLRYRNKIKQRMIQYSTIFMGSIIYCLFLAKRTTEVIYLH